MMSSKHVSKPQKKQSIVLYIIKIYVTDSLQGRLR
jgi:hypothetical protein